MWCTARVLMTGSLLYSLLSLYPLIQPSRKGSSVLIICSLASAILYSERSRFCLSHCFEFVLLSSSIYLIASNKCSFSDLILLEISATFLLVPGFCVFSSGKYRSPIRRFNFSPSLSRPITFCAVWFITSFSSSVFEVQLCCCGTFLFLWYES